MLYHSGWFILHEKEGFIASLLPAKHLISTHVHEYIGSKSSLDGWEFCWIHTTVMTSILLLFDFVCIYVIPTIGLQTAIDGNLKSCYNAMCLTCLQ